MRLKEMISYMGDPEKRVADLMGHQGPVDTVRDADSPGLVSLAHARDIACQWKRRIVAEVPFLTHQGVILHVAEGIVGK